MGDSHSRWFLPAAVPDTAEALLTCGIRKPTDLLGLAPPEASRRTGLSLHQVRIAQQDWYERYTAQPSSAKELLDGMTSKGAAESFAEPFGFEGLDLKCGDLLEVRCAASESVTEKLTKLTIQASTMNLRAVYFDTQGIGARTWLRLCDLGQTDFEGLRDSLRHVKIVRCSSELDSLISEVQRFIDQVIQERYYLNHLGEFPRLIMVDRIHLPTTPAAALADVHSPLVQILGRKLRELTTLLPCTVLVVVSRESIDWKSRPHRSPWDHVPTRLVTLESGEKGRFTLIQPDRDWKNP